MPVTYVITTFEWVQALLKVLLTLGLRNQQNNCQPLTDDPVQQDMSACP